MSFGGNVRRGPLTSLWLAGLFVCVAPVSQALAFCEIDADCDDFDACTTNQCIDTVCVFTPIDVPVVCDDGNACTTESCDTAIGCVNTPECLLDSDCSDSDACTTDTCSPQGCCVFTPIDVPTECDDGNACTTESCDIVTGCANTPLDPAVDCDDGDACTTESCDVVTGCVNTPECVLDIDCTDGDDCTVDSCTADGCCTNTVNAFTVGGAIYTDLEAPITSGLEGVEVCVTCDCGFNACAITAGPWGGWSVTGVPEGVCMVAPTLSDWCFSHVSGGAIGEPAPRAITVDQAHFAENLSIQFLATQGTNFCCLVTADCDDGDACTLDECEANVCSNTDFDVPVACNDNNACTTDTCDSAVGCVNTPFNIPVDCNDDDVCTTESCDPGVGCLNTPIDIPVVCDDGVACTEEACDPLQGCQSTPIDANCQDNNACTTDTCDSEIGCLNTPLDPPVDCNDNNACTTESCDPEVGCVNTPFDIPVDCDDGVSCTDDACDILEGCQSTPIDANCDDSLECTINSCDPVNDCQFLPVDAVCDDGVDCTTDLCDLVEGCQNVPDDLFCNDSIGCTQDLCNVIFGCQSVPNSLACDDGDPCTSDVCDGELGCLNTDDCEADLDCSGAVGAFDLASLLANWGTDPGGPPDFNGDGTVGAADLAALLAQWGPCVKFPGACCNVDGSGTCLQLTQLGCAKTTGLFLGPGVPCEECPHLACGPDAGDCCIANGTPGCDMDICCNTVCDTLPFCCDGFWDELCAERAEQVCAACALPPENDDCPNALVILDGDTDFDTTSATTDGPAHEECQFDGQTHNDVWYDYTATCSGELTVSTCAQATFDTALDVYDGCACPVSDANLLGCNDDFGGPCELTSQVTVPVNDGNCYKVRIGGFNIIEAGTGTVTITCNP